MVNFLCSLTLMSAYIYISVPPPCYRSSTKKDPGHSRLQVIAKHACTRRKKRRSFCAWLYDVHRTCAAMAAVSGGTSQVTTKQRCI